MLDMRLIAGSGRSGTTWVLDALATANSLRPVFEPLHPHVSEIGNRYAHRAISSEESHPDLQQFFADTCAGRRDRLWLQYRQQSRWLFPSVEVLRRNRGVGQVFRRWRKLLADLPRLAAAARRQDSLVKCIRSNLMLGWLGRQCGCRTVLIVRHPGAVIESELRGAWTASFMLNRFREDATLEILTAGRYRNLLNLDLSPIEELAVRWIIENQWVLESAKANDVTVVFYENLMTSPEREWRRICGALDLPRAPDQSLLARPSQQSARRSSISKKEGPASTRWMRALSRQQADLIQRVLDKARFDTYSMREAKPAAESHDSGHSIVGGERQ